jgi:hypothetical protein
VATIFTLVVVPLLFSLTLDMKAAFQRLTGGADASATGAAEPAG